MNARKCHVRGLAFDIADLILARHWAERHDCRMSICLDHGVSATNEHAEEFEEIIAFIEGANSRCRLIMWRDAATVFVQPLNGRMRRHSSVTEALNSMSLRRGWW
jgi:hypothetical protein